MNHLHLVYLLHTFVCPVLKWSLSIPTCIRASLAHFLGSLAAKSLNNFGAQMEYLRVKWEHCLFKSARDINGSNWLLMTDGISVDKSNDFYFVDIVKHACMQRTDLLKEHSLILFTWRGSRGTWLCWADLVGKYGCPPILRCKWVDAWSRVNRSDPTSWSRWGWCNARSEDELSASCSSTSSETHDGRRKWSSWRNLW